MLNYEILLYTFPDEIFSGIKRDGTDAVSSEMLGDLNNKSVRAIVNLEGVSNV